MRVLNDAVGIQVNRAFRAPMLLMNLLHVAAAVIDAPELD